MFFKPSLSQMKALLETKLFYVFCLFYSFCFFLISQLTRITETELYPVHSSKYLFTTFHYEFLFALKPLFYTLLKILFSLTELLPIEPISLARFFFAINGLVLSFLLYLYLEKKTNRYNAVLALLILACTSIFLNRAFRVRSDMLLSSVSFFILWMNLYSTSPKKQTALSCLLLLLFFISPKAIYWLLLNLLLLEKNSLKKPSLKLFLSLCSIIIGLSFLFKDPLFITSVHESLKFYYLSLKIYYPPFIKWGLIEASSLFFIKPFIDRNYLFFFFVFVKLCSVIYQSFSQKKVTDWFFLVLMGITFLHPEAKLVFFASLTPFFIVSFFTDPLWLKTVNKLYSKKFQVNLLLCFFIYAFSWISYFTYNKLFHKNNLHQKRVIKTLNEFYKDTPSNLNILDPSCLIHSRKTTCKYLLYQENFDSTAYIKEKDFDIILSSGQLDLLTLLTESFSSIQYVSVKNHILSKAFVIDTKDFPSLMPDKNLDKKDKDKHLSGDKIFNRLTHALQQESLQLCFEYLANDKLTPDTQHKSTQGSYFYTYIHNLNLSLSIELSPEDSVLLPFKNYTEEEWRKSFIPIKEKRIAVFYLPFPLALEEKKALNVLLKYDFY